MHFQNARKRRFCADPEVAGRIKKICTEREKGSKLTSILYLWLGKMKRHKKGTRNCCVCTWNKTSIQILKFSIFGEIWGNIIYHGKCQVYHNHLANLADLVNQVTGHNHHHMSHHHHNDHHLSLISTQPPLSVTTIITITIICHYYHNHHHLSLSSSQPPPVTTIITTTSTNLARIYFRKNVSLHNFRITVRASELNLGVVPTRGYWVLCKIPTSKSPTQKCTFLYFGVAGWEHSCGM